MSYAGGDYSQLAGVVRRLGLRERLCIIYDAREDQIAAALPDSRTSLEPGGKCFYIADENTAAAVLNVLGKGGSLPSQGRPDDSQQGRDR
jgi:hypothetical protein